MSVPIPAVAVDPAEWRWLPPEVYLPTVDSATGASPEAGTLDDGTPALPVYTSLFTLTAARGADQAWIAVPASQLRELSEAAGCTRVLINPRPPVAIPRQRTGEHPAY